MTDKMPTEIWVWRNDITPDSGYYQSEEIPNSGVKYLRADKDPQVLVDALEKISRMKNIPDHASNTFTLAIAHQLAGEAIKTWRGE